MDKIERKKKKEARKEEYNYVHKIGDICPLSHLKINQVGKVINFNFENKALRRRLLDMGITKGVEIEIVKISNSVSNDSKGMIIKVTDEDLISKTGGIVQGMSGSPIIQNGKLVGAVTHVYVSQPTKGYAIFADTMINEMKKG